jgi:8-oxo-dGTP diphosphatase
VKKAAYAVFRHLPPPVRRAAVRAGAPSFTVGAVAVLRRPDGQVVFVEQRHSDGWALPGGLLRRGESPADAVVREVAEETGMRLDPLRLPVPLAAVAPGVRRVDVVYVVDVEGDVVMRAEDRAEVKSLGWFPLDAPPQVTGPTVDILRGVRLW